MKKTVLSLAMAAIVVTSGCSSDTPNPTPTPGPVVTSASPDVTPTPPQITRNGSPIPTTSPNNDPEPTKNNEPTTPATSLPPSDSEPPQVQFIGAWGKKYPSVEEYKIVAAANSTCEAIVADGWESDPDAVNAVETAVVAAGMPASVAIEFGQDASQRFC
jgi:hypothetical protein